MVNLEKYTDFLEAAKESDALSLEGFFGESTRELTLKREFVDQKDFLSACIDDWLSDVDQYGKDEVKKLIFLFIQLYSEAIQKGGQEAIDALSSFMTGFPENPETECMSSFTECLRLHVESKNVLQQTEEKQTKNIADKKRLGGSISTAYSKGVELISKILSVCITLMELAEGKSPNQIENYNFFLWKKSKKFKELSSGKYDEILHSIDRDIRNAEAHLNLIFIPDRGAFKYKVKSGKKYKTKEISSEKFILNKYMKIGWISQGFIYSALLTIIAHLDPELFKTKMKQIYS
jgi:hypothetical protein